jgi:hypothetical protein
MVIQKISLLPWGGGATAVKFLLKPGLTKSDDIPFTLTEDVWNVVCAYLAMFDKKLQEL